MAPTAIASQSFPHIRDYTIVEQLYAGKRTAVYRAIPVGQQQPVVIKVLQPAYSSFSSLVQFRNQYAITQDLPVPGIVRSLSLEPWQNSYALVMEDFSSLSLQQYAQKQALPVAEMLAIALQIADILHDLCQQRVVHKDIKPANILIEPTSKQIKLIDFSIASLLIQETSEVRAPNELVGTLAYLAPEQTGRMNRSIDYRTDFYGLGVTLYELLTGRLPFQSEDPMELVHCHIAQSPVPPDQVEPSIPPVVSAIVLKLMAKNAEDRYQSARGLKHDLAQCLTQWQQAETIVGFELGECDRSGRFSTPEKLYGREAEVQTLLEAAMRVAAPIAPDAAGRSSEMLLVAGFSGIGKTVVVNEVHKPITQQRGYFIKGKFDQFNRNLPLFAFVQALQDLSGQLLTESDTRLAEWRAQILDAVGESGQVLIDIIPDLAQVIGQPPPAVDLSGAAVQNRFRLLLQKFIAVFATAQHPLVIFLDDLQWADSDSLQLIKLLLANQDHLLLIGAYRDNEVSPTHPLTITVEELAQAGTTIHQIALQPLPQDQINQLVADTLGCQAEVAKPLTEWVYQRTKGNPFFTKQFLQGLHRDGHITFDYAAGAWQCDIAQIQSLALTDDVVEFMAAQLQKLPAETQTALKLAACIGAQFDLSTLAAISQQSQTETAGELWPALQEGLILSISENYKFFQSNHTESVLPEVAVPYKFLHDRVQQAAYSLIPPDQKQKTHYRIGQRLLQTTPLDAREENIFEIVNQLNQGTVLIADPKERYDLAQLNLIACQKAKNSAAYQSAREYASIGRSLLGEDAWQQQYETSLALYTTAAELASLCGDFAALDKFIEQVIEHARSVLEKASVYRIKIQASTFQNKPTTAIDTALQILQRMGITFPQAPTEKDIQQAMLEIGQLMSNRDVATLADLPAMTDTDREKIAIVQIANSVMPAAYISGSPLFPLLVALSVKLSIQHGNTPASAYAYACYGIIACNLFQDIETGIKFGQLALQVISKLDAKAFKAEVSMVVGVFIFHRKSHIRETLPLLKEGYVVALEVGNLEYVGYNAKNFCFNSFWCGQPLSNLEQEARAYYDTLTQLSQLTTANYCQICLQSISRLLAIESLSGSSGEVLQAAEFSPRLTAADDSLGLFYFSFYRLMLGYLFGDLALAQCQTITARRYLVAAVGMVGEPLFYFYDSLVALADSDLQREDLSMLLTRVEQNQTQLKQYWISDAPMNYQHKTDLVAAEKCRVLGQKAAAIELYDRAIAGARANRYIQEEALANELCAKFFLAWDKEKIAAAYMQAAYTCYVRWEAQAKVADLEQRYPQLLAAISQSAAVVTPAQATITPTLTNTANSASSSHLHLDFLTITKAAQAISQEIELDKLLATLMQTVIASAGAQIGYLILRQADRWQVVAQADKTCVTTVDIPVEQSTNVPHSLIYSVARTYKTAVFENLGMAPQFESDRYVSRCQPKSALCTPVSRQGKLVGVLYLENNLIEGAFTRDRIEILQLLTSQAAISIENARLYQQTEDYSQSLEAEVTQKTQALNQKVKDLEATLKKLKETQLQLIQTEKMSSLGQLVAGIAHEINNPVNFIHGNIQHLEQYTQDLFKLIDAYQQDQPQPSQSLQDLLEETDLDFLAEDAQNLLKSLQHGSDRIKEIVLSLRNFSRLDEADLKQANVHDGIESTLVILQHRLKAAPEHTEISIVRDYGDLPPVECHPGQLNQVLMNLLSNAIDALIEHPTAQNTIRIETETLEAGWIAIRIVDSGKGIPEAVRSRIFDPFFTTKPVGKGTGLGLSISYQIVTEKHGGRLYCHSTPGQGTAFVIELPVHSQAKST